MRKIKKRGVKTLKILNAANIICFVVLMLAIKGAFGQERVPVEKVDISLIQVTSVIAGIVAVLTSFATIYVALKMSKLKEEILTAVKIEMDKRFSEFANKDLAALQKIFELMIANIQNQVDKLDKIK